MLKNLKLITFGLALVLAGSATAVYAGCGSCGPEADDHVHAAADAHGCCEAAAAKGVACEKCAPQAKVTNVALTANNAAKSACPGCADGKKCAGCAKKASGECAGCEPGKKCADCAKKASGACEGCPGGAACGDCGTKTASGCSASASSCTAGAKSCGDGQKTAYSIGSQVSCFKADHAQSGEAKTLTGLAGSKATVLIFWNQTCPYVVEADDRIADFAKEYKKKGVNVIAVDSGVVNSKGDIASYAKNRPFPVLVNSDSSVAAAFGAVRTPEVFVLDGDKKIVYHGAFDSGREREAGTRKNYVKDAVSAVLAGDSPKVNKTPAFGCGIKYQKGVKALPTQNVIADATIK